MPAAKLFTWSKDLLEDPETPEQSLVLGPQLWVQEHFRPSWIYPRSGRVMSKDCSCRGHWNGAHSTTAYCSTPDLVRTTGPAHVQADVYTQRAGPQRDSWASWKPNVTQFYLDPSICNSPPLPAHTRLWWDLLRFWSQRFTLSKRTLLSSMLFSDSARFLLVPLGM